MSAVSQALAAESVRVSDCTARVSIREYLKEAAMLHLDNTEYQDFLRSHWHEPTIIAKQLGGVQQKRVFVTQMIKHLAKAKGE